MPEARFFETCGRLVVLCPACGHATMAREDGAWACRPCAGTVLQQETELVKAPPGFRGYSVRRRLAVAAVLGRESKRA